MGNILLFDAFSSQSQITELVFENVVSVTHNTVEPLILGFPLQMQFSKSAILRGDAKLRDAKLIKINKFSGFRKSWLEENRFIGEVRNKPLRTFT